LVTFNDQSPRRGAVVIASAWRAREQGSNPARV
jgi:hypothetical protein